MQILDKKGVLTIKLTQDEGRRLRDAAFIARRISKNISDEEWATGLEDAAKYLLDAVHVFCPKTEKLDQQDAETPPVLDEDPAPAKKKK